MSQSPSLAQIIEAAINERLESFWTAVPARVVSFDRLNGIASIRIQIANADQDGAGTKRWYFPVIHNVPVIYPGGDTADATYRITFPLSKINNGLFIVSTLSAKRWFANNGSANIRLDDPSENRNNLSSGFLIPGLSGKVAPTEVPEDAMVLWGDKIKIGGKTDTNKVATSATLDAFMSIIAPGGVPLTDPAGAIAILYDALVAAQWPHEYVCENTEAK